ncbi:hypothetical protein NPIL_468941 [Nephila pilipes]|uniref:Uncharacterized protein n=1 Tax=Nephila pilipes TaxID=299642 RepID=A0A8X6N161_NEPPI|nr:hypothetical protein NPIL_468941 [Nephila pilipes]
MVVDSRRRFSSSLCKAVVPLNVSAEMTNSRKLSEADIAKLIETSDRKEENVSEYENHTSDEIVHILVD